jgi:hypothetical protein
VMSQPPNPRLQRTPSAPLSRKPLGATLMRLSAVVLLGMSACVHVGIGQKEASAVRVAALRDLVRETIGAEPNPPRSQPIQYCLDLELLAESQNTAADGLGGREILPRLHSRGFCDSQPGVYLIAEVTEWADSRNAKVEMSVWRGRGSEASGYSCVIWYRLSEGTWKRDGDCVEDRIYN